MNKLKTSVIIALAAFVLASCNGQEDFGGDFNAGFIYDPNPDPNFNPSDGCAPRIIGLLQAEHTVANVGYSCGGFLSYTGKVGLPEEKEANYFVCPLGSKSITFLLGGNVASVPLGKGAFRYAISKNLDPQSGLRFCEYEQSVLPGNSKYLDGVYDADGPYLFSVADLFDDPVRVDVVTDGEPNEIKAQNISALLTGLDSVAGNETIDINDEAHRQIFGGFFSELDAILDPAFFTTDFATFVMNNGTADLYLQEIEATVSSSVGTLPTTEGEAEEDLVAGNGATAAGLYRFDLLTDEYFLVYNLQGTETIYKDKTVVTDYLASLLADPKSSYEDVDDINTLDVFLISSLEEYLPFVLVDRRQRMIGGGAFDVVDFAAASSGPADTIDGLTHLCAGNPLYLALSSSAELLPDLRFSGKNFTTLPSESQNAGGVMSVPGRFIQGQSYSGIAASEGVSDYDTTYRERNVTHVFDSGQDKTVINTSSLCTATITDQIPLGYGRQGVVAPSLDKAVMTELFGTPDQYQLRYLARDPSIDVSGSPDALQVAALDITIHEDGTVLTDLVSGGGPGADGNPGYDATAASPVIPAGEYVIGMVSSVYRANDDDATVGIDESITEAEVNLLVYNLGPASAESEIPKYGSHFRARLDPDTACEGDNRLYSTDFGAVAANQRTFWFDPKDMTDWFRSNPSPTQAAQYEAVRTKAYGIISAVNTQPCTP